MVFASSVSDAQVSYCRSIAINPGQQFLYKDTSYYTVLVMRRKQQNLCSGAITPPLYLLYSPVLCKKRGAYRKVQRATFQGFREHISFNLSAMEFYI
jgi:hypothetical protein